jgi:hypothetical protein
MAGHTPKTSDLVTSLAKELLDKEVVDAAAAEGEPAAALATALAEATKVSELVPFVGFVGGAVKRRDGSDWRVLYLSWSLATWLFIEADGIRASAEIEDRTVPGGRRGVLWVDAHAVVGRCEQRRQSMEARFLTGEFVTAGDFDAPLDGGSGAGTTGLFSDARTPSCCLYRTRR